MNKLAHTAFDVRKGQHSALQRYSERANLPGKSADVSAAAPGTQDADWLLGLDEVKASDDVVAMAAAERRKGLPRRRRR